MVTDAIPPMPHAVIPGATKLPAVEGKPILQESKTVFRVVETAHATKGWLLKCVIIQPGGESRKFLARVDTRDDGLVVHLDDHMSVERDDDVFHFLALIAVATLRANPGTTVGKTNLQKWLAASKASA